jgi:hypothetical protein
MLTASQMLAAQIAATGLTISMPQADDDCSYAASWFLHR